MHYRNGRLAQNGDHVITKNYDGKVTTGVIHNLRPGTTCNCDVSVLVPGGTNQLTCQDVGQMFHAEDAFHAVRTLAEPTSGDASAETPVQLGNA